MASLQGSQTEKNLLTAFAGESQARNRYDYYAKQAKDEGFVQISKIFERTAAQEKEHAKRLFKFLQGGEVEVTATFPAGVIGTTLANLEAAAVGENHEHTEMYPHFAEVAQREGLAEIAVVFKAIARAEKQHEKQYRDFIENIKAGRVFKRDDAVIWYCINCGYIHEDEQPPEKCPSCAHSRDYFQVIGEEW